jgi:hypothetical protein
LFTDFGLINLGPARRRWTLTVSKTIWGIPMTTKAFLCGVAIAAAAAVSPVSAAVSSIPAFSSATASPDPVTHGTDLWANDWTYTAPQTLTYSGIFKGTYQGDVYGAYAFSISFAIPNASDANFSWGTLTGTVGGQNWDAETFGTQVTFWASDALALPGESFSFSISYISIPSTSPDVSAVDYAGTTATWSVSAIPEMSTWAMMGLGLAGLGFAGYRPRRAATSLA